MKWSPHIGDRTQPLQRPSAPKSSFWRRTSFILTVGRSTLKSGFESTSYDVTPNITDKYALVLQWCDTSNFAPLVIHQFWHRSFCRDQHVQERSRPERTFCVQIKKLQFNLPEQQILSANFNEIKRMERYHISMKWINLELQKFPMELLIRVSGPEGLQKRKFTLQFSDIESTSAHEKNNRLSISAHDVNWNLNNVNKLPIPLDTTNTC